MRNEKSEKFEAWEGVWNTTVRFEDREGHKLEAGNNSHLTITNEWTLHFSNQKKLDSANNLNKPGSESHSEPQLKAQASEAP